MSFGALRAAPGSCVPDVRRLTNGPDSSRPTIERAAAEKMREQLQRAITDGALGSLPLGTWVGSLRDTAAAET